MRGIKFTAPRQCEKIGLVFQIGNLNVVSGFKNLCGEFELGKLRSFLGFGNQYAVYIWKAISSAKVSKTICILKNQHGNQNSLSLKI